MKKSLLRRSASLPPLLDWCLLLLLLAASTPAILFRHQTLFIAPPLDLLDGSWLLDTSYKAATGVWFGRDVAFTYGPLFQCLSSAPSRWLGISTGAVYATWYTLPFFVTVLATFLSAWLLFQEASPWKRRLFFLLAVVFWSPPDVRTSVSIVVFLGFVRLADAVASDTRARVLPALAAGAVCIVCFLLSADTGLYGVAALLLSVTATCAVKRRLPGSGFRLMSFLALAGACFAVLMLATNAAMASPLNFKFWDSGFAVATSYRWFEPSGMSKAGKRLVLATLAMGVLVFGLAWRWREPESRGWTLRPAFLLSGFCFSFLMLQSGLVRSDFGHVLLATFPMIFFGGAILIGGRTSAHVISAIMLGMAVVVTLLLAHPYWAFVPGSVAAKWREIRAPILVCPEGFQSFDHACFRTADSELLSSVSAYIDQHTDRGDPILVFPYETAFGLTSRRRVAGGVLQSYLVNGEFLTNLELAGLRRSNPPFGLYFPDGVISQGVDGIPNFTRSPELWFYLLRHYRLAGTPANGVLGLARDETRDRRLIFNQQNLGSSSGEIPITSRNSSLDLGPVHWPPAGADFLKLRLRVAYSPWWKIRKPSRVSLQITFADGSQKRLAFLVEPNRTSEVWLYPWDETGMGSYFASDESEWRLASRPAIVGLKLLITRLDWISVVPSRVFIESVAAVRISMPSRSGPSELTDNP